MNALVKHEPMNDDQVGLVKRMIAKDASDDELTLFLQQCSRTGLDPFSKQIYAIGRWSKDAGRKVMSIQVSIDGARLIAERTGKYDSQEGPYWCGEDGVWKDVWLAPGHPCAAKVLVYKVGSTRGTTGIAHWGEYADKNSSFWTNKPALMLAKCAEMLALRKAFPQELSGLYSSEEMGQADNVIDVSPDRQVDTSTGEIVDSLPVTTDVIFQVETTPYWVTDWHKLTGKEYDLVKWIATLHDKSDGACTAKQYQYLTGLIDALTNSEHNYILSLLCQSEISADNMPGTKVAKSLIEILPQEIRLKDKDGKEVRGVDGKFANPAYRPDICELITALAQQPEAA